MREYMQSEYQCTCQDSWVRQHRDRQMVLEQFQTAEDLFGIIARKIAQYYQKTYQTNMHNTLHYIKSYLECPKSLRTARTLYEIKGVMWEYRTIHKCSLAQSCTQIGGIFPQSKSIISTAVERLTSLAVLIARLIF